jgi:hypothetical protein
LKRIMNQKNMTKYAGCHFLKKTEIWRNPSQTCHLFPGLACQV